MMARAAAGRALLVLALALALPACKDKGAGHWTEEERQVLRSLWIENLPPLAADPSNSVSTHEGAAALGQRLFFDAGLSADGTVSCASCHRPEHGFADPLALSRGLGTTGRNAPSVIGSADSPWMFWDGRADSQWAQALGPIEHPDEMGATRGSVAHRIASTHRRAYERLFSPLPELSDAERFPSSAGPHGNEEEKAAWQAMSRDDRQAITGVFVNVGKAIAAYERLIMPGASRFDDYVAALESGTTAPEGILNEDELAGLRLFLGEGSCTDCHAGPLFTNHDFANVGIDFDPSGTIDQGRGEGVKELFRSEFTCLGPWSDAEEEDCDELRFIKSEGKELLGAVKVPSLRTAAATAPFMHRGQLATLRDVVLHYDRAPRPVVGHSDLEELGLSEQEVDQLVAFLRAIASPVAAPPELLRAPPE